MSTVARKEAAGQLDQLLEQASRGEEVVIEHEDGRHFRLVLSPAAQKTPRFGSARGQGWMSEDFDEELEDFEGYMR